MIEAANGREALERLANGPVDVVLLDIILPELRRIVHEDGDQAG